MSGIDRIWPKKKDKETVNKRNYMGQEGGKETREQIENEVPRNCIFLQCFVKLYCEPDPKPADLVFPFHMYASMSRIWAIYTFFC